MYVVEFSAKHVEFLSQQMPAYSVREAYSHFEWFFSECIYWWAHDNNIGPFTTEYKRSYDVDGCSQIQFFFAFERPGDATLFKLRWA